MIRTQTFKIQLPELTISSFLWTFVAKHRSITPEFYRLMLITELVLVISTYHRRSRLWTESQASLRPVLKSIHLLFDYICCFSYSSGKKFCMFKNRKMDLPVAEYFCNIFSLIQNIRPFPGFIR